MAKRVSVPILVRLRTQSECRRPPKLLFNCITFIFKSAVRGAGGNRLNVGVKMKISIRYSILSSCLNEGRKKREWPVGLFTRIAEPEPPLPTTSTLPSMSKRTKLIQYLIKLHSTVQYQTCSIMGGSDTCSSAPIPAVAYVQEGLRSFARLRWPSGSPVIKTNLHLPMQIPGSHHHHHHFPDHHSE